MGILRQNISRLCVVSLCVILTNVKEICCNNRLQNNKGRLFIFGDSVFDTGNNMYLSQNRDDAAAHWPYGMSLNSSFSGRYSDGYLVPDYIASLAKLHNIRPFAKPATNVFEADGVNFASARVNLTSQLANMMTVWNSLRRDLGFKKASAILQKSVFLFGLCGDDYSTFATNFPNASSDDFHHHVFDVIGNLTNFVLDVYRIGGRRFAFQNASPLGCLPAVKQAFNVSGGECASLPQKIANFHNQLLSMIMNVFEILFDDFKHSVFDYHTLLSQRINHPQNYGFKNGEVACCGKGKYRGWGCGRNGEEVCRNPKEFVFFDGGHTTQSFNLQAAVEFWNGSGYATKPYTVSELFRLE